MMIPRHRSAWLWSIGTVALLPALVYLRTGHCQVSSADHDIRRVLSVLTHDSLGGRGTPSSGLEAAARYVAAEFERRGLRPYRDAGFLVHYQIRETEALSDSVELEVGGTRVRRGGRLAVLGDHNAPMAVEGEVLLVTGQLNSATLRRMDFAGKTLLVPRPARGGALDSAALVALVPLLMESNPHAIVFVADLAPEAMSRLNGIAGSMRRALAVDPLNLHGSTRYSHAILALHPSVLGSELARSGVEYSRMANDSLGPFTVRSLAGTRIRITVPRRNVATFSAPNVIGVLPGADPALSGEYVVVSAHLDHLGVGAPGADGDSIYNGADDNASGVSVLLSVAQEYRSRGRRPRRSVLFLATSGEEWSYWGSDSFAGDSATRLSRLVANINIDGVGRPTWPDSILVLGGELSSLGDAARSATALSGSGIHPVFESTIPYTRSDHYSFARRGVPSVHLFSGTLFPYYHTVKDDLAVIDVPWLARVASYTFQIVHLVAEDAQQPTWNAPAKAGITRW